jgi:hypothetical protein
MSSRNSAPLGSAVLPVYNALGGPQGKGHVTFNRAQSQYLDAGPRTLNIATNGGLTIVAVVRFTGDPGSYERIIDLGSGQDTNNLILSRWSTNSGFQLVFQTQPTGPSYHRPVQAFIENLIEQNTWVTVVVRYSSSTRQYVVKVNNAADYTGIASDTVPDRTVSGTYMGRSAWSWEAYFNGDMAGVFVVDEYLSADATSAIADTMARGEDLTTQGPCAPQVLSPLLPVALSSADQCPILIVARSLCLAAALAVISLSCGEVHACPC